MITYARRWKDLGERLFTVGVGETCLYGHGGTVGRDVEIVVTCLPEEEATARIELTARGYRRIQFQTY